MKKGGGAMIFLAIALGMLVGTIVPISDIKILPMIIFFFVAMYLQMIIHEVGHLVGGLLTGYKFSSFRIGSLMLINIDGKLKFKRYTLAGTGGQCLMNIPDMVDGKVPYKVYGLGGVAANAISGVICLVVYQLVDVGPVMSAFLVLTGLFGLVFAAVNGIPMENNMVANDGYNTKLIGSNPKAMRAYWIQIKINEEIVKGVSLKDMPEEWFEKPEDEDMDNVMVAALAVFRCNRLMSEMRIKQAYREMDQLIEGENAVLGIHKKLLTVDCMYCEMVTHNRVNVVENMLTDDMKKFLNTMRRFPSVIRMAYTHTLLVEGNEEKAKMVRSKFDEICRTYPHQHEIAEENRFMDYALYLFREKEKNN